MKETLDINFKNETYISRFLDKNLSWSLYDIGVGPKTEYFSLSNVIPKLKVFGTEPDPRQFKYLKDNFNKIRGVLLNYAVSDEPIHTKEMFLFPTDLKISGFIRKSKLKIDVKITSLDNLDTEMSSRYGVSSAKTTTVNIGSLSSSSGGAIQKYQPPVKRQFKNKIKR